MKTLLWIQYKVYNIQMWRLKCSGPIKKSEPEQEEVDEFQCS